MNILYTFFCIISGYFLIGNLNTLSYYLFSLRRNKDIGSKTREKKYISIIIPAYQESEVIEKTIESLESVAYSRDKYEIIVATYQQDIKTREVIEKLKLRYPNVKEVINPSEPNGKARNINYAYPYIEDRSDIVGFHDAEDRVTPNIFNVANFSLEKHMAVQFKVIPEKKGNTIIERTYAIGFSKYHDFILPVKEKIEYIVPSAGTGIYIKRGLLDTLDVYDGKIFNENNLSEDFELSLRLASHKIKISFNPLAIVREKFPHKLRPAIKQRTRWAIGNIQSMGNLKLNMGIKEKIGLLLDYLSLGGIIWIPAFILGISCLAGSVIGISLIKIGSFLWYISILNTLGGLEEIFITPYFCHKEYNGKIIGYLKNIEAVIVNDIINSIVILNAIRKYAWSKITKKEIKWDKTERR